MKNKKRVYLIISIVSFTIALLALAVLGVLFYSYNQAQEDYEQLASAARAASPTVQTEASLPEQTEPSEVETEPPVLVDIPINFDYLQAENPDIIGWILVDGTLIDYPILYDTTTNLYYLNHNYEGTSTGYGSIFVLGENAGDFTDFNTVVYGHNMLNGQMFAQLHKFRDKNFFDSHGQILIYTQDRKLTYQVFAAYRRDNLDIIANYAVSSEELRETYLESVFAQTDLALFNDACPVTAADRIVTLSTCIGNPSYRYVVQGVLISDEPGAYAPPQDTVEES